MQTILVSFWLVVSAGIGFWVAHEDDWGKPEARDQKRKLAYYFVIRPAAVIAVFMALGWQVALAAGLLMGQVLAMAGLGLGRKSTGGALIAERFFLPVWFGYCIVFNQVEPLRYLFAVLFAIAPFGSMQKDERFLSVLQRMNGTYRKALLLFSVLIVVAFLAIADLVWRYFGLDGWIWVYAYFPLLFMVLTMVIVVPFAHNFPDKAE